MQGRQHANQQWQKKQPRQSSGVRVSFRSGVCIDAGWQYMQQHIDAVCYFSRLPVLIAGSLLKLHWLKRHLMLGLEDGCPVLTCSFGWGLTAQTCTVPALFGQFVATFTVLSKVLCVLAGSKQSLVVLTSIQA